MEATMKKRFHARRWVELEVALNMDGYGNTRKQAIEFVIDLLQEGEYQSNDELTDAQGVKALIVARELMAKEAA